MKRQVRKLLLLISGSKEQYRHLRDMHTLETRIRNDRTKSTHLYLVILFFFIFFFDLIQLYFLLKLIIAIIKKDRAKCLIFNEILN